MSISKEDKIKLIKDLEESGVDVSSIESPHQFKWLLQHPEFERYPVCIETFINSKKYLGSAKCRRAVKKKMIEIFGDQTYVDNNPKSIMRYDEVVDMEGIGSGKTFSASIFILYGVYRLLCLKSPQDYYNKSSMSGMYFMLMSISEKNARDVIFGEINARILENKEGFFVTQYPADPMISTQLNFDKNIKIIPGNSSEGFFVGYNIFMAVIDECDDHKKTAEKDYVVEGYTAIRRRITSRFPGFGGIMMIGSPRTVNGFMMRKYRQANNDDKMIGIRLSTWEALDEEEFSGPQFSAQDPEGNIRYVPIEYKRDYENNPERFWRDLGALPSFSIEPFITYTQKILNAINPRLIVWDGKGQLPEVRGTTGREYIAHVDLGINKDGNDHCGIAVGRIIGSKRVAQFATGKEIERPHFSIEFLCRLSANAGSEIQISEVRRLLIHLKENGFNYHRIQFDGWQSKDSQQILSKMGITVKQVSVDRDTYAYEAFKEALYEDRIEYGNLMVDNDVEPDSKEKINIVVQEASQLIRKKGSKIDHPVGGSKDVTDAIAGVVFGLTESTNLHKIGIRYNPQFVRDDLNIEQLGNNNVKQTRSKQLRYSTNGGSAPKIAGGGGIW